MDDKSWNEWNIDEIHPNDSCEEENADHAVKFPRSSARVCRVAWFSGPAVLGSANFCGEFCAAVNPRIAGIVLSHFSAVLVAYSRSTCVFFSSFAQWRWRAGAGWRRLCCRTTPLVGLTFGACRRRRRRYLSFVKVLVVWGGPVGSLHFLWCVSSCNFVLYYCFSISRVSDLVEFWNSCGARV